MVFGLITLSSLQTTIAEQNHVIQSRVGSAPTLHFIDGKFQGLGSILNAKLTPERQQFVSEKRALAQRFIGYGLAIFLIISLIFLILIRSIKKKRIALTYGSTWLRWLVLAGLSFFLLIIFMIGWINLERNRDAHINEVNQTLTGVLSIFQDRLELWLVERKSFMKQLGYNPELANLTQRLLEVSPEKNTLLVSNELKEMRSFFKESSDIFTNIGFFIINSDYISIGSRLNTNVGTLNLISKKHPDLLKKAFQGEVGFVPPITSDVQLGKSGQLNKKPLTMFFIGPIHSHEGKIIAVFTLRINPWRGFTKTIKSFESLESGEIYAFDKSGLLLTPSRFDHQLRQVGLLSENQESALNIEIRDPGVNLLEENFPGIEGMQHPLTKMVQRTLKLKEELDQIDLPPAYSKIESDTIGYRDYRGVPVFGAWLWNNSFQIGLTAELDIDEALGHYYQTRFLVMGILGFTLFLSVSAVLLVLILGERASRTLVEAHNNLEDEVAERTTELRLNQKRLEESEERSRLLLNSVGEGIFGVDLNGKVTFINPVASSLLGYEPDELIGQKVHQKIHHSYSDKSPYPIEDCPMAKAYKDGATETISDEMLWRKNGTGFSVEYTATPLLQCTKISGSVITFRDITKRKQMEEALMTEKAHLQKTLDASPVGVGISTNGIMRFVNPRMSELFDMIVGDPAPQIYLNNEDRNHIITTLNKQGVIKDYELQMFGKDKEIKDMLVTYMNMTYEGQDAVLGWVMDITNLKKTDQELQKNFDELSLFRKIAVGRELKMIEIKKEINDLSVKLGQPTKYKIIE